MLNVARRNSIDKLFIICLLSIKPLKKTLIRKMWNDEKAVKPRERKRRKAQKAKPNISTAHENILIAFR